MTASRLEFPAVHTATPTVRWVLRWVFHRDGRAITCEVAAHDRRSYDVTSIKHWDASATVTESFNRPLRALERHASIAQRLRDDGWVVVDHSPAHMGAAA